MNENRQVFETAVGNGGKNDLSNLRPQLRRRERSAGFVCRSHEKLMHSFSLFRTKFPLLLLRSENVRSQKALVAIPRGKRNPRECFAHPFQMLKTHGRENQWSRLHRTAERFPTCLIVRVKVRPRLVKPGLQTDKWANNRGLERLNLCIRRKDETTGRLFE